MLDHNKQMKEFLKEHGIDADPKYISEGSMSGVWRLTGRAKRGAKSFDDRYQKWTSELQNKMTLLGFTDFDGQPLSWTSGNGGIFCVFVHGPRMFNPGYKPEIEYEIEATCRKAVSL
jgi:hypothetical protein